MSARAWLGLAACAAVSLAAGHASGDTARWDLRVRRPGATVGLRMRQSVAEDPSAAAAAPAPAAAAAPAPAPVAGAETTAGAAGDALAVPAGSAGRGRSRRDRRRAREDIPAGPGLDDQVVFRFNLGFGLDGAQPSSRPSLDGSTCLGREACRAYTQNRIYGFGDVVLGSRGLGTQSLAGYLAAQFRFDQSVTEGFSAVPTVYDGDDVGDVQVRSAYAEVDRRKSGARWLRALYLRVGRQYRHGAAVAHFDGATLSYDTRVGSIGLFGGYEANLYGLPGEEDVERRVLGGVTARLNLAALGYGPIVLTANTLGYDDRLHSDVAAAVRIRRSIDTRVRLRRLNGELAQADLQVRARLSAVTTAVLDVDHSTLNDWRYDPLLGPRRESDTMDARRYLDLEPPGPRTYLSVRAGTVLLDNVDLLVRAAGAVEHQDSPGTGERTFATSYFEGGAALEVRLQRTLSLALSSMARVYEEPAQPERIDPTPGAPDALPAEPGYAHDLGFIEAGAVARYSEGARVFSAEAELYARAYERVHLYELEGVAIEDERVGGRMSVEGWAGEHLRLRIEYDATAELARIRELRGLKSLRLMLEGRF